MKKNLRTDGQSPGKLSQIIFSRGDKEKYLEAENTKLKENEGIAWVL